MFPSSFVQFELVKHIHVLSCASVTGVEIWLVRLLFSDEQQIEEHANWTDQELGYNYCYAVVTHSTLHYNCTIVRHTCAYVINAYVHVYLIGFNKDRLIKNKDDWHGS